MDEYEISLTFLPDSGESITLGGNATPVNGIISTRCNTGLAGITHL
jgi:hypothetical protein